MDFLYKFLEQISTTRVARQVDKAKKVNKEQKLLSPHTVTVGYDSRFGAYLIRQADGSIKYAYSQTNGVIPLGETVPTHYGSVIHIDNTRHKKKVQKSTPTLIKKIYPFKILFSILEGGIRKFYVGGDRKIPQLIFEIDESIYYAVGDYNFGFEDNEIHGYISNLGVGKNDWVVGIKYSKWDENRFSSGDDLQFLSVIRPASSDFEVPVESFADTLTGVSYPETVDVVTYSDYETTGIGLLRWRGAGLWISDQPHLMAVKFYDWEYDAEDYSSYKDFSNVGVGAATVRAVMPLEHESVSGFIPPWSSVANYVYNPTDHIGIRSLYDQLPIGTNEVWTRVSSTPDSLGNYEYTPPTGSYNNQIHKNIESTLDHSVLIAPVNPYAYTQYTEGEYTEIFLGSNTITSLFGSFFTRSKSVNTAQGGYFALEGVRKYLLVDSANGVIQKVDYDLRMTEGDFQSVRNDDPTFNLGFINKFQQWKRFPQIFDITGENYILPNSSNGNATSLRSQNDIFTDELLNGVRTTSPDPAGRRYEQNYSETILASPNLECCLFKKIEVDSTLNENIQSPTSTTYHVYNSQNNTEYQINDELQVDPRLSTFSNKNGYTLIYWDSVPEEIKTQDRQVEFNELKFKTQGINLEQGNLITKKHKIFSLNIDTNLEHCIENVSYFPNQ